MLCSAHRMLAVARTYKKSLARFPSAPSYNSLGAMDFATMCCTFISCENAAPRTAAEYAAAFGCRGTMTAKEYNKWHSMELNKGDPPCPCDTAEGPRAATAA